MNMMVYDDFLSLLNRTNNNDIYNVYNTEDFPYYEHQIDTYLDNYFKASCSRKQYEILKARSLGFTLEEIGNRYQITRERVRQILIKILSKVRNPNIVQGNDNLRNLFSFLCGIGECDIRGFLYYLFPKKHILLLMISDELYKKSLNYEKQIRMMEIKNQKKAEKERKVKEHSAKKIASDNEIKRIIILCVLNGDYEYATIGGIADAIMEDYKGENKYNITGRLTWSKVMDVLLEMRQSNKLKHRYGKFVI